MDLRKAYQMVIEHLLDIVEEHGEESLKGVNKEKKAIELCNNEEFTRNLVLAVEDFIEDYGYEIGLR